MNEDITPKALSPHFYVWSSAGVTGCSLFLYYKLGQNENYVFLPALVLAALYALLYFIRQCHSPGRFSIEKNIDLNTLLKRSIARYLVWLVVLVAGYQFYLFTPPYNTARYGATPFLFENFLYWYLWLGIPYFALTLTFKSSRVEDFYDPAIRFLHVGKQISKQLTNHLSGAENRRPIFYVFKKQYNRKIFLNLIMRAYFIPVMVMQVIPTTITTVNMLFEELANHQFMTVVLLLTAMLWLIDVLNAVVAYCMESRWLENRSRSIDLTIGGWIVCLSCYPPINNITGSLFAFAPSIASNQIDDLLFSSLGLFYAAKIIEMLMLTAHIYSDVSLGPSGANITLKKLQTRGPYGIIHHPGTTTKLLLWLAQAFIYRKFWTAKFIIGYLGWGTVYVLRAFTEERHLKKFSEYREYCKKVKHRFFPGLF
ncbi:MAG: isoprenylcysteine carboxylmethyltransferase family protein [Gammaproteobacteria bacterium]|nr:isoprenylcysteine carboxylmethyltransferase family protein [Gammaproteobacteria bacterium]